MNGQRPLKSVHITNYYHKNSGGISTAYNHLLEAANRHERFVRLIVPGESDAVEEVGKFGRIYYVKASKSPLFDKRYRVLLPWKTYIFDKSPIKTILRDEQPDIVEIGEKYTLSLLAGLLRKGIMNVSPQRPMLVHFSCERMDDNIRAFVTGGKAGRDFSRGYVRNYLFPMFDFHLANSDYTAGELLDAVSGDKSRGRPNRLLNFFWRVFRSPLVSVSERVFVNQCGADMALFDTSRRDFDRRREILSEAGFPNDCVVLFYAGRISPEKNVKLLVETVAVLAGSRNREFRLLIAGDGPKREWLSEQLERAVPGKFKILGHVADRDRLANIYANSDIFLHPNPHEPFGIGPLEAMASGLPVVAPDSGGVLSYATDENAWLRPPRAVEFASAITEILDDDIRRRAKTAHALQMAKTYSWEASTDRLFGLHDRMYADFTARRELFDYHESTKSLDFRSYLLGDLNKFTPAGVLLAFRCCDTRMQALACVAYLVSLVGIVAFAWLRRTWTEAFF